jgi:hypothetical protein
MGWLIGERKGKGGKGKGGIDRQKIDRSRDRDMLRLRNLKLAVVRLWIMD